MTFDKYCKQIKEILSIESLTKEQSSALMSLYLTRASVEEAAKKLKEK
jgi:hypothetical protein